MIAVDRQIIDGPLSGLPNRIWRDRIMARILLVDDDDSVRIALRRPLERMGHQVVEAQNGKEALAFYRADPVDLILIDLVMPEKEGLETIRELRQGYPEVKIVAMSGGTRACNATGLLRAAEHFGARRVLAKP